MRCLLDSRPRKTNEHAIHRQEPRDLGEGEVARLRVEVDKRRREALEEIAGRKSELTTRAKD